MPTPIHGQVTMTGSAVQLSATPIICQGYTIKAPVTNAASVYIGASTVTTANGFQLDPGESFDYQNSTQHGNPAFQLNISDFFAVGTGPDKLTWFGSP